jgi:hypothetical protein
MSVKYCDSYNCKFQAKTDTGCTTDIEIRDGVCVTYSEGKFVDYKINPMRRNKGGSYVNNKGGTLK